MNIKLKEQLFRVKIFFWYLGTEPFRQTKQIFFILLSLLRVLNKTITWAYIATAGLTIFMFLGNRFVAAFFLVFLLLMVLLWEWQSGNFMYRYRQVQSKKIKKVLIDKESSLINGGEDKWKENKL